MPDNVNITTVATVHSHKSGMNNKQSWYFHNKCIEFKHKLSLCIQLCHICYYALPSGIGGQNMQNKQQLNEKISMCSKLKTNTLLINKTSSNRIKHKSVIWYFLQKDLKTLKFFIIHCYLSKTTMKL